LIHFLPLSVIQNFHSSTMDEWRNRTICFPWNASLSHGNTEC
jgi:hypothetical protein